MPKRSDIRTAMVIGSGPIVIGQAAEFDYSGSQACRSLREEGVRTVLVNSKAVVEGSGVTPLGPALEAIQAGEDREKFRELMLAIDEPIPKSRSAGSVDDAKATAGELGYPVVVHGAPTLVGT